jgi:hypothetical protein
MFGEQERDEHEDGKRKVLWFEKLRAFLLIHSSLFGALRRLGG